MSACDCCMLAVLQSISLDVKVFQRFVIYSVPPATFLSCSHWGCCCMHWCT